MGNFKNIKRKNDNEEWLGDSGESSHIEYNKKEMKYVKKWEINGTLGNDQKMKCELKGSVNMKIQGG